MEILLPYVRQEVKDGILFLAIWIIDFMTIISNIVCVCWMKFLSFFSGCFTKLWLPIARTATFLELVECFNCLRVRLPSDPMEIRPLGGQIYLVGPSRRFVVCWNDWILPFWWACCAPSWLRAGSHGWSTANWDSCGKQPWHWGFNEQLEVGGEIFHFSSGCEIQIWWFMAMNSDMQLQRILLNYENCFPDSGCFQFWLFSSVLRIVAPYVWDAHGVWEVVIAIAVLWLRMMCKAAWYSRHVVRMCSHSAAGQKNLSGHKWYHIIIYYISLKLTSWIWVYSWSWRSWLPLWDLAFWREVPNTVHVFAL